MNTSIIRAMQQEDIESVMTIEEAVCEFPWSASIYSDCIKVGYHCFISETLPGEIVGYGLLSIAAGEAHVLNICIKPSAQHHGLGYKMMQHLISLAKDLCARRIYLEVRMSNVHAIALYEKLEFVKIGQRTDYYPAMNGREDAWVYAKKLNEPNSEDL